MISDGNNMTTETEPLIAALHAHIKSVAERPIDIRMLTELEKTCLLARELMVVGQQPDAIRKRSMIQPAINLGYDTYGGGMMSDAQFSGAQAYSSPQETFGVTAIRELVSSLSSFMPKPREDSLSDLMAAISHAKAAGDTELEQQLRAALREKLGPSAVSEPPHLPTVTLQVVPQTELAATGETS